MVAILETLLAVVLATLAVVAMVVILLVAVMLLLTMAMVKVLMLLVVLHMMRVLASRRQRVSLALPWLHIQCGLRTETFLTVCIPLRTCIASLVATSPPHIHHVVPVFCACQTSRTISSRTYSVGAAPCVVLLSAV